MIEIPLLIGLLKSVIPGILAGLGIDAIGSFRKPARRIAGAVAHRAVDESRDWIDGDDDEPHRAAAAPPRRPTPAPAAIDPPLEALGLDALTLDALKRARIKTVGGLRQVADLQEIAGVGPGRAANITQALRDFDRG